MSKSFQEQEAKNKVEANEKAQEEINNNTVVFWAPATDYQIANFTLEERSGGHIMRGEEPLRFTKNMYILAYDGNEITKKKNDHIVAFIEASNGFKNGLIKKFDSVEAAQIMSSSRTVKRKVKEFDITSGGPDGFDNTVDGKKITKVVGA